MLSVDYEDVARELVRALRGRRSQVAFSRRLHYKSNVCYLWESGRHWPTAATAMWAAERTGRDLGDVVERFYRQRPEWLARASLATPEGIAAFLNDLRGDTPIGEIAERVGRNRFAVSRWLKGQTEPRLPDFLRLLEASSLRMLDFLSLLVDPRTFASVAEPWRQLQAARTMVSKLPWSPAVLLVLQTADYKGLPAHEDGWISRRLGIPREVEQECLELLAQTGQIRQENGSWRVVRIQSIDTRSDPNAGKRLKAWWAQVGLDQMRDGAPGLFSYNVFSVSRADLARLEDMHRSYYRALRAVVAASEPPERVVVTNLQLFALDHDV